MPSVVITLGIGWDVQAEKKLKEQLPNGSRFYGADPIYEQNDKLYSEIGQYFPLAVGNETKVSQAYVMPKELKGQAFEVLLDPLIYEAEFWCVGLKVYRCVDLYVCRPIRPQTL
ncbi:unnamed protein product [Haemonchus placei]|uniref:Methyltransf_21 domain-containing protein n=1 Tax=Haemonchus placei TaxID=6290 RepID=A0A0N4VYC4_HAEPC|nr:unnamed protein product [Haemonchus placei]